MKILFMIGHLSGGGAERIVGELSKNLEKDNDVSILIFEDKGTTYPHCRNIINIDVPGSDKVELRKATNIIRRCRKVRKLKKQLKPDVTVSFLSNANLINVLTGYTKTVCSVRNVLSEITRNKVGRRVESFVLRKCDKVVSLSDGVKRDLVECFNVPENQIVTIHNFVSENLRTIRLQECIYNRSECIFCTMGRLTEQKGQWHLIKAFSEVKRRIPKSTLRIYGEGPLEKSLKKLAEQLGVSDSVKFCGFDKNPWIHLTECNIYVFPSMWEGFGNALVEAMYCGLPVIATNCDGGISEIINPKGQKETYFVEYGILIPKFEKKDIMSEMKSVSLDVNDRKLADAMIQIAEPNRWEHYHIQSIKRATDFSIENIRTKWLQVFAAVTRGK